MTCPTAQQALDQHRAQDGNWCRENGKDFKGNACAFEVLKATMTQLLLLYTRLLDLLKASGPAGQALMQDAVTVTSIMYEIKRFSRT